MRDYIGVSPGNVPSDPEQLGRYLPELRRDLGVIDFFLHDLSRAMKRLSDGEKPDGSGDPIIPPTGDFWFKPGIADTFLANMQNNPGGSGAISSTAATTKGFIYFGSARTSAFDETNQRIGVAVAAPAAKLDILVGAPDDQSLVPVAVTANTGVSIWTDQGASSVAANLIAAVNDGSDATYVSHDTNLGTLEYQMAVAVDPGVNTGHKIQIRALVSSENVVQTDRLRLGLSVGTTTITSPLPDEFPLWCTGRLHVITYTDPIDSTGDGLGTSFETFEYTLTSAEAAAIRSTGAGYSDVRINFAYYTGNTGRTVRVSSVRWVVPPAGGSAASDTLQKWSTGAYTDLLDFSGDGGGGATLDLTLSGDSPLRVSSGGGTSGLRFLTSSTNGRIEAGTSAQANMNLVLSGTRATAGTLLTSDFTAHLMNGALDVFLSTDRAGLRVRQFTTATLDLVQFGSNAGVTNFYRMGSDGQSYFTSSTTAGIVNIGGGNGPSLEIGTDGSTGMLTIRPGLSSAFDFDFTNASGIGIARFRGGANQAFNFRGRITSQLGASDTLSNITHTITKLASQTGALFEVQNDALAALITVNAAGQMQFTATAGAEPIRIVSGAGAGKVLTSDVDGDASWQTLSATLDDDLDAIAALTGDGGLYRIAADTWALRDLAVGSDRLTISNADGVSGNPSYDASMSSASWDWTRGISVDPSVDETSLVLKSTNQTAGSATSNLWEGYSAGGTVKVAQMRNTGRLVLGSTDGSSDGIVRLDLQSSSGQSVNVMQAVINSIAAFSVGAAGAVVVGQGNSANSNLTRFTIHPGPAQSQDILTVRDPTNAFSFWTLSSTGRMSIRDTTAGTATTFDRTAGGSGHTLTWPNAQGGASTVLTNNGSGVLSWGAAGVSTSLLSERATQVIAAATTMVVTDGIPVTPFTTASGSDVTSTAVPFIAAGRDGQLIVIRNDNGTDAAGLILRDTNFFANSGMRLDLDTLTLAGTSTAGFIYSATMSSWVFQWYKKLKHYTGAISTFTVDASGALTHEWGDGSTTNDTAPVFALTYSGIPTAASVTITASPDAGYPLTLSTPFLAGTGAVYFRSSTRNGTRTFRASATVNGSAVTSDVIVTYRAPNYSGVSTQTTNLTSVQVVALTHTLDTDPYGTYSSIPATGASDYVWFGFVDNDAVLDSTLYFSIAGMRAKFDLKDNPVSVTSTYLKVANYETYRSTTIQLGTVSVVVQSTRPPNRRYVGKVGQATQLSEAQIEALQLVDLTESPNGTFASITSLGAGDYLWFCVSDTNIAAPTHYGISPSAGASGYEEAAFTAMTVTSVTNIYGFTENYKDIHSVTTGFQAININAATTTTWSLKTQAAAFNYRFFVGPSTATAISSAQILAIDDTSSGVSSVAAASLAGTYAVTVSGSNYLWVCHEDVSVPDIGTIKDVSTGFAIAGAYRTDVTGHTSDFGVGSLTYRVWRSDNPAIFPSGGNVVIT